jgi:flagellar protein FliO/FliZ
MSSSGRRRRLQTVEVLPLDSKTRAVLLRRDDTEHLVVIGPDSLAVVETIRPNPVP